MSEPWYRRAFGAHYPVLYAHRDESEAERCLDLLLGMAPLGGDDAARTVTILDLGCGDGRHLESLRRRGHDAVGLDLSAELLVRAARRDLKPPLHLVRGDMAALPFADGSFTAVLSLFTAFGYFGALDDNEVVVRQVARVLAPGGRWFLDYLDADRVRAELAGAAPAERSRRTGPLAIHESRFLGPGADRVIKEVRIVPAAGRVDEAAALAVPARGIEYREQVALFAVGELDGMAGRLGLERVAEAGSYDGAPLGAGDRWILIYRRRGDGIANKENG